jgi:hypothetical protein
VQDLFAYLLYGTNQDAENEGAVAACVVGHAGEWLVLRKDPSDGWRTTLRLSQAQSHEARLVGPGSALSVLALSTQHRYSRVNVIDLQIGLLDQTYTANSDSRTHPKTSNCDQRAVGIAKNPIFHKRTKHIDSRFHWVREKVQAGRFDAIIIRDPDCRCADKGVTTPKT